MRKALSKSLHLFSALALVFCAFLSVQAQTRDARVISARAGGINFVSGDATVKRAGQSDWQRLSASDELAGGDTIRTGGGGRVEVLLNPGSYLRLGGDSEFELIDPSLDGLRLRLSQGSAIVEATGYGDADLSIAVVTPRTQATIIRSGIYRFNVPSADTTEVVVQKGRAVVGGGDGMVLKGGKVARVGANGVEVVKYEKKNRDAFDQWGRERAQELARANRKLSPRSVNTLLAGTRFDDLFSWSNRRSGGLWLRNAALGCYTFVPFFDGWSSPYGFWYDYRFALPFGDCGRCAPAVQRGVYVTRGPISQPGGVQPAAPPILGGSTQGGGVHQPAPTHSTPRPQVERPMGLPRGGRGKADIDN